MNVKVLYTAKFCAMMNVDINGKEPPIPPVDEFKPIEGSFVCKCDSVENIVYDRYVKQFIASKISKEVIANEDKTKTNIAYVIDVTLIDFVVMKNNDREISEKDWFIYTQQKVEKQKRKKKQ